MNFEAPETVYKLDFSETQYAGLEVAIRATTIDELLEMQALIDGPDTAENMRALFTKFAGIVESWNVTKRGEPVPLTYKGLASLELPFVMAIINAWQLDVSQAPPPLPGASNSGASSPAELTAAASLSRSLQS